MGNTLSKKAALFDRDENENLVPKEREIIVDEDNPYYEDLKGKTVFITPMTRGELKKFFAEASIARAKSEDGEIVDGEDSDAEIIMKHLIQPKYDEKDLKFMKGQVMSAIVTTIFFESGVDLTGGKSKRKAIEEAEDDFAKN